MQLIKSALIFFSLGVLMFVAKPFIGFSLSNNINNFKHVSICVKAFSKRKQEYVEGSNLDIKTALKKLSDPVDLIFLTFAALLGIVLPLISGVKSIANHILKTLQLALPPAQPAYLLNGNLII